ncbi:MAG TPA: hypothetical protein VGI06_06640, partial [Acidimicrobiales bacterium]
MGSPWTKRVVAMVVGAVVVAGAGVAVFLPAGPHRSGMASSAVTGGVTRGAALLAHPPANAGVATSGG